MDVHVYGEDLVSVSVFFRSTFAHDTQVPPQASWCERSHLVFLQGKVNSASYFSQVVNPVLLTFLRQEGDVLFQQDNARPHTAAATQRVLRVVQQLPWLARSPIEHLWDLMKRELIFSPEPATIIAELQQRMQDAWDSLSQDDIRHLYHCLHTRIHTCVVARGVHFVMM